MTWCAPREMRDTHTHSTLTYTIRTNAPARTHTHTRACTRACPYYALAHARRLFRVEVLGLGVNDAHEGPLWRSNCAQAWPRRLTGGTGAGLGVTRLRLKGEGSGNRACRVFVAPSGWHFHPAPFGTSGLLHTLARRFPSGLRRTSGGHLPRIASAAGTSLASHQRIPIPPDPTGPDHTGSHRIPHTRTGSHQTGPNRIPPGPPLSLAERGGRKDVAMLLSPPWDALASLRAQDAAKLLCMVEVAQ